MADEKKMKRRKTETTEGLSVSGSGTIPTTPMVEKSSGKVTPGKVENKTELISTTSTISAPEPGSSRMADRDALLAKQGTESHGHDTPVKPGAVPSEHFDMMTHILKELLSATKNSVSEQTPVRR